MRMLMAHSGPCLARGKCRVNGVCQERCWLCPHFVCGFSKGSGCLIFDEQTCRKEKSSMGLVQAQTAAHTPFADQPSPQAYHVLGKAAGGSETNPTGSPSGLPHWLGRGTWIQTVLPRELCHRIGVAQVLGKPARQGVGSI